MEVDYRVVCCNTQEGQNEPDDDAQMSVRDSACTDTGTVAPDPDNAASPGEQVQVQAPKILLGHSKFIVSHLP